MLPIHFDGNSGQNQYIETKEPGKSSFFMWKMYFPYEPFGEWFTTLSATKMYEIPFISADWSVLTSIIHIHEFCSLPNS